jgi:hypothetical protein
MRGKTAKKLKRMAAKLRPDDQQRAYKALRRLWKDGKIKK